MFKINTKFLIFTVLIVILMSGSVFGDVGCSSHSAYDSVTCNYNKDSSVVYSITRGDLNSLEINDINNFREVLFDSYFPGNSDEVLYSNLVNSAEDASCYQGISLKAGDNAYLFYAVYLYIYDGPANLDLRVCSKSEETYEDVMAYGNFLVIKPNMSLNGDDCLNCAFLLDNLDNEDIMDYSFGKSGSAGGGWECNDEVNPGTISLNGEGLYVVFVGLNCDGKCDSRTWHDNEYEQCRANIGVNPNWEDGSLVQNMFGDNYFFYNRLLGPDEEIDIDGFTEETLISIYGELSFEQEDICYMLNGEWNETISSSHPCCSLYNEGEFFQIEGVVWTCTDSVWISEDVSAQCVTATDGLVENVWNYATFQNPLNPTSDGSDGCCGDDWPDSFTQTGLNDLYYVDDLSQYLCSIEESDTMELQLPGNLQFTPILEDTVGAIRLSGFNGDLCYTDSLITDRAFCYINDEWIEYPFAGANSYTKVIKLVNYNNNLCAVIRPSSPQTSYFYCLDNNNEWGVVSGASFGTYVSIDSAGNDVCIGNNGGSTINCYNGTSWDVLPNLPFSTSTGGAYDSLVLWGNTVCAVAGSSAPNPVWCLSGDWMLWDNYNYAVYRTPDLVEWEDKLCVGGNKLGCYDGSSWNTIVEYTAGSGNTLSLLQVIGEDLCFYDSSDSQKIKCYDGTNVYDLNSYDFGVNPFINLGNSVYVSDLTSSPSVDDIIYRDDTLFYDFGLGNPDAVWNWLDAYNEEYVVHNVQLADENINVISNSDNWYVCNATGSAKDILGFEDNYVVDNFDVLPAEGDRIGYCPQGWYYCSCINSSNNFANTPLGCYAPNIELSEYTHHDYHQCISSPYLCNSDYDYSNGTVSQCGVDKEHAHFNVHPNLGYSCSDGEELFGPFEDYGSGEPVAVYGQNDNSSCPAVCGGFPVIAPNTPFNPPGGSNHNEVKLKSECSNANALSCFGTSSLGFFEISEEDCQNGDDDDGDCCISGYTNGICAVGQDTNGNGIICDDGDIGVDCLDADCINAGWCESPPIGFEYKCNDSIDNDGDCCNNPEYNASSPAPYYTGNGVCLAGFENNFEEICSSGSFNTDCMDADCLTSAQCVDSYGGLSTFAAPKNHSVICYERSGESIFTECCDNFGLSCFNSVYQNKVMVDKYSEFVGRGVPLYAFRTFDQIDPYTNNYIDYVGKYYDYGDIALLNDANHQFEFVSDAVFPYYNTLEFDVGFTTLEDAEIIIYFELSNGSFTEVIINQSNFNEYSMNGDQEYRWHHIVINLDESFVRFDHFDLFTGEGNLLFDNVFFGVDPAGTIYGAGASEYQNYKCAGAFGFWIDEFDPDQVEAPEMSCQDVDHDNEGCTACDWVDINNDTCNISTLINTPSSTGWYDFDPFKYVCDSYLSFGWSGTKCCGDDTNQTNKEFYWDYKGACWNGYNVIDNQRMGDVLYLNDEENHLNKFLFHKNFSVCNEPTFELDSNYANNNKEYIGLDSAITYTLDIGGDQYKINMYNNSVCDIKGNYYCSGGTNNLWRDDILGVPDWTSSNPLFLKDDPYYNSVGCCPKDYCWNGDICVHATVYEDNSSMPAFNREFDGPEHILFNEIDDTNGFRCVFDATGDAVWEDSTAKYDWNLDSTGYCKHSNYCFVDEGFQFLNTTRYTNYQKVVVHNDGCCDINSSGEPFIGEFVEGEDTEDCLFVEGVPNYYINVSDFACQGIYDCIPNGTTINETFDITPYGNYYCDNGNWTSKVSQLASKMCDWFDCDANEFSIVCDDDLLFNMNFTNENNLFNNSVYSACVYQQGDVNGLQEDVVAIGFVLKDDFATTNFLEDSLFNGLYGGTTINCENNLPDHCTYTGSLIPDNYMFYYDPESNILLVSTADPVSNPNNFINGLTNFIYGIFHPSFSTDFFVLRGNSVYDKLFMAHSSDGVNRVNLQVMAAQEFKFDESKDEVINRIFVNYSSGFNLANHLNDSVNYALFEKDALLKEPAGLNHYLVDEIIFNKCTDEGFLLIKKPMVNLMTETNLDFDKDDMLWTYLTKTLRLTGEPSGSPVYTGDTCSECNSENPCDEGLECYDHKCRIISGFGLICNFDEECLTGTCENNNQCSFCGNNFVDINEGEQCDGTLLSPPGTPASCIIYGYDGGVLSCSNICQHDTSQCTYEGGWGW